MDDVGSERRRRWPNVSIADHDEALMKTGINLWKELRSGPISRALKRLEALSSTATHLPIGNRKNRFRRGALQFESLEGRDLLSGILNNPVMFLNTNFG